MRFDTCFSSTEPGEEIASSTSLTISCIFSGLISGGNANFCGPSLSNTNCCWVFSSDATRSFSVFSHTAVFATPARPSAHTSTLRTGSGEGRTLFFVVVLDEFAGEVGDEVRVAKEPGLIKLLAIADRLFRPMLKHRQPWSVAAATTTATLAGDVWQAALYPNLPDDRSSLGGVADLVRAPQQRNCCSSAR